MPTITTQVIDTTRGTPADGIPVALEHRGAHGWEHIGGGTTDEQGRVEDLGHPDGGPDLPEGVYQLTFDTGTYYAANEIDGIFPVVRVVFEVKSDTSYHLPLVLGAHSYTTYLGA
jgi:5-hydroxyisourate hydrolase